MPRPTSIPPRLHAEVLARAGDGLSCAEIASWLGRERSVTTHESSVKRLLRKVAAERAPIAKAVVTEQLSKTLTTDLSSMDALLKRSFANEARCQQVCNSNEDPLIKIRAMEQARRERNEQRALLDMRLRLSGAGNKGDDVRPLALVVLPAETPDE